MKYLLIICALAGIISFAKNRNFEFTKMKTAEAGSAHDSPAISPADLRQITQDTKGKVLVYFWQPKCGSCVMMEPIVDQTEKEFPNIPVIRVNTRLPENREIHDKYAVTGTPTFIVLEKDRILARNNGPFLNKGSFQSFLRPSKISRTQ